MSTENLQYEVCVDSAAGARAAHSGGAHRVELCGALTVGGITPSAGLIQATRSATSLGLHVLIRPRPGDFVYDAADIQAMVRDIELCHEWGVDGVVIGALTANGSVATAACAELLAAADDMSVTFHRAFDVAADPMVALEDLVTLGVDRVLTSGQAANVWDGRQLLRQLVDAARGRVIIMPGAGVDENNAGALLRETGARELHFSARRQVQAVPAGGQGAVMGADAAADRQRGETDVTRVRNIITAATI